MVETRTQFPLLTDNIKLLHENPRPYHFSNECDKQVVLDYGFEKKPLVQVVVEKAKEIGCDASEQAVMWEGQCMECDCAVALMNMLAVQAAELHARLSKIEDILGDDYDLDRLAAIMNQRMSMREDVAERWKLTSDIPIDRLRELAQADREGRCVVLPCKIGDIVWCIYTGAQGNHPTVLANRFEYGMIPYWGISVFPDKKQAEAALKEREKE